MANEIDVYYNTDEEIEIIITENGTAVDITGWTFYFTVKENIDDDITDAEAVINKTWTEHSDPTNGTTNLTITADDNQIDDKIYCYAIKTDNGTEEVIQATGRYRLSRTARNA